MRTEKIYNTDGNSRKRDEAIKLLRTGKFSAAEIARNLKLKERTVRQWRQDLGISPTRRERKRPQNHKPTPTQPVEFVGTLTPFKTVQAVVRASDENTRRLVSPPSGPVYEGPPAIQPQVNRPTPTDLTPLYQQAGLARREDFNPYDPAPLFNFLKWIWQKLFSSPRQDEQPKPQNNHTLPVHFGTNAPPLQLNWNDPAIYGQMDTPINYRTAQDNIFQANPQTVYPRDLTPYPQSLCQHCGQSHLGIPCSWNGYR